MMVKLMLTSMMTSSSEFGPVFTGLFNIHRYAFSVLPCTCLSDLSKVVSDASLGLLLNPVDRGRVQLCGYF